jgi:hypothetical protein
MEQIAGWLSSWPKEEKKRRALQSPNNLPKGSDWSLVPATIMEEGGIKADYSQANPPDSGLQS